jgi:hypothetical protein
MPIQAKVRHIAYNCIVKENWRPYHVLSKKPWNVNIKKIPITALRGAASRRR